MTFRTIVTWLTLAGILGIVAAVWSGSGAGLGPVREGATPLSSNARNAIMVLALIGSVGALAVAFLAKFLGSRLLGVIVLVLAVLLAPSLIQANVLSIVSLVILVIVGLTVLVQKREQSGGTSSAG